jgi:glutamate synthase domain-containing protein 3
MPTAVAPKLNRAERLAALVARVNPSAAAAITKRAGKWPYRDPQDQAAIESQHDNWLRGQGKRSQAENASVEQAIDQQERAKRGAPYELQQLPDGRWRIRVFGDEGDSFGAVGTTVEDALSKLEVKVK